MSLATARSAVVSGLQKTLKEQLPPALAKALTVEAHPGEFDIAELRRLSKRTPAVCVALLGVGNVVSHGGEKAAEALFGVYVLAAGGLKGEARDLVALSLLPSVLARIEGNRWGLEAAETIPQQIKADNLFSGTLDSLHVALWAVSFRQRITISAGLSFALAAVTHNEVDAALAKETGQDGPCPNQAAPLAPGETCPVCDGSGAHQPIPVGVDEFLRAGVSQHPDESPDAGLFPVRR
jgi:hypothetical protein